MHNGTGVFTQVQVVEPQIFLLDAGENFVGCQKKKTKQKQFLKKVRITAKVDLIDPKEKKETTQMLHVP